MGRLHRRMAFFEVVANLNDKLRLPKASLTNPIYKLLNYSAGLKGVVGPN